MQANDKWPNLYQFQLASTLKTSEDKKKCDGWHTSGSFAKLFRGVNTSSFQTSLGDATTRNYVQRQCDELRGREQRAESAADGIPGVQGATDGVRSWERGALRRTVGSSGEGCQASARARWGQYELDAEQVKHAFGGRRGLSQLQPTTRRTTPNPAMARWSRRGTYSSSSLCLRCRTNKNEKSRATSQDPHTWRGGSSCRRSDCTFSVSGPKTTCSVYSSERSGPKTRPIWWKGRSYGARRQQKLSLLPNVKDRNFSTGLEC